MIYKYRVSLPGLKGFARVYELKAHSSLFCFHKQMRSDMDFPQDQIVLFKAVDYAGNAIAKYATVDIGWGTIDEITLEKCHENEQDHFVYFYDTINAKSVLVDFVEECDAKPGALYPLLVESKGPNPVEFENGYVAFEDLPADKKRDPDDEDWEDDDEDMDDSDDEEGDDEDGEEIYDENEQ